MLSPTLGALITEIYLSTTSYKERVQSGGVAQLATWLSRNAQVPFPALSAPGPVLQFPPYNWSNNRKTIVTISWTSKMCHISLLYRSWLIFRAVVLKIIFLDSFYCRIVDLQCCVNFCCIAEWVSYTYIFFFAFFPLYFITGYWI